MFTQVVSSERLDSDSEVKCCHLTWSVNVLGEWGG